MRIIFHRNGKFKNIPVTIIKSIKTNSKGNSFMNKSHFWQIYYSLPSTLYDYKSTLTNEQIID